VLNVVTRPSSKAIPVQTVLPGTSLGEIGWIQTADATVLATTGQENIVGELWLLQAPLGYALRDPTWPDWDYCQASIAL
jgi:hypothetical protein